MVPALFEVKKKAQTLRVICTFDLTSVSCDDVACTRIVPALRVSYRSIQLPSTDPRMSPAINHYRSAQSWTGPWPELL